MATNSTVQKVMQISEEAAPAVHIPMMVGNEVFVLTQQDIRRVEDIRMLTYTRLTATAHLGPFCNIAPTAPASPMGFGGLPAPAPAPTANFCTFPNFSLHDQKDKQLHVEDMEEGDVAAAHHVASIGAQLQWAKQRGNAAVGVKPFHCSTATSTSNLLEHRHTSCQHCVSCRQCCCQTPVRKCTQQAASQTLPLHYTQGTSMATHQKDSICEEAAAQVRSKSALHIVGNSQTELQARRSCSCCMHAHDDNAGQAQTSTRTRRRQRRAKAAATFAAQISTPQAMPTATENPTCNWHEELQLELQQQRPY